MCVYIGQKWLVVYVDMEKTGTFPIVTKGGGSAVEVKRAGGAGGLEKAGVLHGTRY